MHGVVSRIRIRENQSFSASRANLLYTIVLHRTSLEIYTRVCAVTILNRTSLDLLSTDGQVCSER